MPDALTWIGKSDPNDNLDLATIVATISVEAKALRAILQGTKVSKLFEIRSEASARSRSAQSWYRRLSFVAILATALATLASGLLLYGAGSETNAPATSAAITGAQQPAPTAPDSAPIEQKLVNWVQAHRTPIVVIQIFALFVSAVAASALASRGLVERWAENRNKAELLRRAVFNEVLTQAEKMVQAPLAAPDLSNPVCQALEFFRRYQHELQITYFKKGWRRHDRAGWIFAWLTAALAGLAAITGVVGALGGSALVLSAFLGIAVPILLSAAQSWRATSRDNDKAAAYEKAGDELDQNLLKIDAVREKAALGDAPAVQAYIDSVHLIMTTENEAWRPAGELPTGR